jgi:hypothetical protein
VPNYSQEEACQEILGQVESKVVMHYLAATQHLDDAKRYNRSMSRWVITDAVCSAKQKGPKPSDNDKAHQTSTSALSVDFMNNIQHAAMMLYLL